MMLWLNDLSIDWGVFVNDNKLNVSHSTHMYQYVLKYSASVSHCFEFAIGNNGIKLYSLKLYFFACNLNCSVKYNVNYWTCYILSQYHWATPFKRVRIIWGCNLVDIFVRFFSWEICISCVFCVFFSMSFKKIQSYVC